MSILAHLINGLFARLVCPNIAKIAINHTAKTSPPKAHERTRDVSAGKLMNQRRAEKKCRRIAEEANATWAGNWNKSNGEQQDTDEVRVCSINGMSTIQQ